MNGRTISFVPLAPTWELWSLFGLVGFYLITNAIIGPSFTTVANVVGPLVFMAILFLSAANVVRANSDNVWTALLWFRIATAVYFGFGQLVPIFANATTRLYMEQFFAATADQIFDLNLLVAAGTFSVLVSARAALATMKPIVERRQNNDKTLLLVGLTFAVIGFLDRVLIVIPYSMGYFGDSIVNGIFLTLGTLASVSLCLLTRYAILYDPKFLPLVFLGLGFEIVVGLLEFNKTDIITAILMFFLGYLSAGAATRRAIVSAVAVAVALALIVPVIDYSRVAAEARFGRGGFTGTLTQRFEIISSYFTEQRDTPLEERRQATYSRLSYTNAATFAMARYDSGFPADTLSNTWTLPIPRALWQDKPNITDVGLDFNELVNGSRNSSSSPGLFADGYWNFGWMSLLYVAAPMGALYALLSRFTLSILMGSRWIQFPAVLLALRMGFRVDGFVITDVLGPAVIFVAMSGCLWFIESVLQHRVASVRARNNAHVSSRRRGRTSMMAGRDRG